LIRKLILSAQAEAKTIKRNAKVIPCLSAEKNKILFFYLDNIGIKEYYMIKIKKADTSVCVSLYKKKLRFPFIVGLYAIPFL